MKIAEQIFSDILTDLMDRRGIKNQFYLVRDDGPMEIWAELVATNEAIISANLEPVIADLSNVRHDLAAVMDVYGEEDCLDRLRESFVRIQRVLALFEEEE